MIKKDFYYPSSDGKTNIHAVKWIPEREIKLILQIAHGVTEHILRYEELAKYLTDRGILVVGNDHLGHGTSISKDSYPMYFGGGGSWNYVVNDLEKLREIISDEYKNISYCLLGFSLGSFATRTYLINYPSKMDGAILVGTGQTSSLAIKLAKFVANKEAREHGEENSTSAIRKLTFETYNKIFVPNKTDYDWLCSSEKAIDDYINDPLRGGSMSSGLFREMLDGMAYTAKINNIKKMDKNKPLLLLSGDRDPVGDCGKGVIKAYKKFKKAGVEDLNYKLYPNLRHDILHEDCKEEIYDYIYQWLCEKFKLNK